MTTNPRPWLAARRATQAPGALDWQKDARCVGEPIATFFPEATDDKEAALERARELCFDCPVARACLDHALMRPEKYGTWSGLDQEERAAERRRRLRNNTLWRAA